MTAPVPCKGSLCRNKVAWAKTPEGKTVPLDLKATVYAVQVVNGELRAQPLARSFAQAQTVFLVNHFSTCPNASEFSGGKARRRRDGKDDGS